MLTWISEERWKKNNKDGTEVSGLSICYSICRKIKERKFYDGMMGLVMDNWFMVPMGY